MKTQGIEPIYYAKLSNGTNVLLRDPEPVDIHPSGRFIVHPDVARSGRWTVTEVDSGRRIAESEGRDEAIRMARERMTQSAATALAADSLAATA